MDRIVFSLCAFFGICALTILVANSDYLPALVIVAGFAAFLGLRKQKKLLGENAWSNTRRFPKAITWITVGFLILIVISVIVSPEPGSHVPPGYSKSSAAMQQARAIYLLITAYADAHNGVYPTGNSSTEIFQKLVDENHMKPTGKSLQEVVHTVIEGGSVTDPGIFCLAMSGKTPATSTQLRPENVCFDVTLPLGRSAPDETPAVFVTGYKVSYVPGGMAIPFSTSRDRYWTSVCYNGGMAYALMKGHDLPDWPSIQPDGAVINFVPTKFNSNGKKFEQLTPEGPISP
jgi:hypothetical protein